METKLDVHVFKNLLTLFYHQFKRGHKIVKFFSDQCCDEIPPCEQHNYQNYCIDIPLCDVSELE